ncbi:hypothetical protein Hanom_Chr16g01419031 [Helianthus anomalus]
MDFVGERQERAVPVTGDSPGSNISPSSKSLFLPFQTPNPSMSLLGVKDDQKGVWQEVVQKGGRWKSMAAQDVGTTAFRHSLSIYRSFSLHLKYVLS